MEGDGPHQCLTSLVPPQYNSGGKHMRNEMTHTSATRIFPLLGDMISWYLNGRDMAKYLQQIKGKLIIVNVFIEAPMDLHERYWT